MISKWIGVVVGFLARIGEAAPPAVTVTSTSTRTAPIAQGELEDLRDAVARELKDHPEATPVSIDVSSVDDHRAMLVIVTRRGRVERTVDVPQDLGQRQEMLVWIVVAEAAGDSGLDPTTASMVDASTIEASAVVDPPIANVQPVAGDDHATLFQRTTREVAAASSHRWEIAARLGSTVDTLRERAELEVGRRFGRFDITGGATIGAVGTSPDVFSRITLPLSATYSVPLVHRFGAGLGVSAGVAIDSRPNSPAVLFGDIHATTSYAITRWLDGELRIAEIVPTDLAAETVATIGGRVWWP
ncbi:MAG: hypothetical protein JWO36_6534 [Myxococcales bacterium]|nr:hypothetical protein [Myxococcales bacterium]